MFHSDDPKQLIKDVELLRRRDGYDLPITDGTEARYVRIKPVNSSTQAQSIVALLSVLAFILVLSYLISPWLGVATLTAIVLLQERRDA